MISDCHQKSRLFCNALFLVAFALLFVVAGLRTVGAGRDSETYSNDIRSIIQTHDYNFGAYEPTFYLIINISKFFFTDPVRGVFVIYAFLVVSLMLWAIRKSSSFPVLSLILFSCIYFVLHEMIQIRVGVAAAFFLLALPNVANWRIRLALLFGKFEYMATGILDESHLKFYTLESAKKFIRKYYKIVAYFPAATRVPKLLLLMFPKIFASQWVFKCK
jgi:EpsG family